MITYWMMFGVPAMAAFFADRGIDTPGQQIRHKITIGWIAAGVLLFLLIGYRYQVGGDWFTYLGYLNQVANIPFDQVLIQADPGFMVLNWISYEFGWGAIGVNLFSGTFFSIGLVLFCRSLPRPWLGLAVAVPYLVIVVGMGYTRQGIALSFALLGFLSMTRGETLRAIFWIFVGATFHKTAILLLPIAGLAGAKHRWQAITWVLLITPVAYFLLLADSVDRLVANYLVAEYQSSGALIRVMMNVAPAALILVLRFPMPPFTLSLWRLMARISLALLAAYFIIASSTAVDRIALYMLPLQLVVFSYLPDVLAPRSERRQRQVIFCIIAYYALVLAVWLFLADHSKYWLPYRFYPFEAGAI